MRSTFRKLKSKTSFVWSCGIIGFIGNEPARDYLLEGINILRSRGYDSAGISTIEENYEEKRKNIETTKFASEKTSDSLEVLRRRTENIHLGNCGIGHTRWATHGATTDINAHPHNDEKNRISIVHNGTVENWLEIKKDLKNKGTKFKSETDSEVIAHLISSFYNSEEKNIVEAFSKAISHLQGTYGLAVLCRDFPDRILAVRMGSPLVVGLAEDKKWVSSEYSAFSRYTKNYVSLKDGEITIVKRDKISIDFEGRLRTVPPEEIPQDPSPFSHWTIKEIMEQPSSINRAMNNGGRLCGNEAILGGLQNNKEILVKIKNLVICACGTSYNSALYVMRTIRRLRCFSNVHLVCASEFEINYFSSPSESALLVISQSGETRDVLRAMQMAKEQNIFIFSVVNVVGSQIATLAKCGVYVNAGREFGVASTKAFTSQVVVLSLIALWFANKNTNRYGMAKAEPILGDFVDSLQHLSLVVKSTLNLEPICKKVSDKYFQSEHIFILGKGYGEAIAKEAALKIKEVSYIHAEGFSGGELKHGPLALIEKGTPVFAILISDKHSKLMRISCNEVASRGARLVIITDNERMTEGLECDEIIKIPSNGCFTALLAVIPFQFIAFYLALKRGFDPDKPRNLAKSVTVD